MQRSRGLPPSLGGAAEAMENMLASLDHEAAIRVRESLAIAYWPVVVGQQAADASEAENVRDGVLFVRTKSSVWSHELTFLKSHILAELNRRIGRQVIREIVFRAQGVRQRKPANQAKDAPTEEELAAVELSLADQAELNGEVLRLTGIANARLRAALIRRVERDRRLRIWRLAHGWTPCSRCGALHRGQGAVCPVCRVCG